MSFMFYILKMFNIYVPRIYFLYYLCVCVALLFVYVVSPARSSILTFLIYTSNHIMILIDK